MGKFVPNRAYAVRRARLAEAEDEGGLISSFIGRKVAFS
jgi:hypothetical protein